MKKFACAVCALMAFHTVPASAATLLVLGAQDSSPPVSELTATGAFTTVTGRTTDLGLTQAELSAYTSVLVYSNSPPNDSVSLGNLLKQYVDSGGRVVLSTYGLSPSWAVSGGIQDAGYSPFNVGLTGPVTGDLVVTAPDDAIFAGVNLGAVSFFHNSNYANPTLDSGATLLATDGNGVAMIAVNSARNVYGFNIFPASGYGTSQETYKLFANALTGGELQSAVPEPSTWAMMLIGFGFVGGAMRSRRRQKLTVSYA